MPALERLPPEQIVVVAAQVAQPSLDLGVGLPRSVERML